MKACDDVARAVLVGMNDSMPYLRLSSLPLDLATKRRLVEGLTDTVLRIMKGEKPEWTTVHFTPFLTEDFATARRLVVDGTVPDVHLELSATAVSDKTWRALRRELTEVLGSTLGISVNARHRINVMLHTYDPDTFAVGGRTLTEMRRPVSWLGRLLRLGALGTIIVLVLRWLAAKGRSAMQERTVVTEATAVVTTEPAQATPTIEPAVVVEPAGVVSPATSAESTPSTDRIS